MLKKSLWITLATLLLFACNLSAPFSTGSIDEPASGSADCESGTEPTQEDIQYVLASPGNTFRSEAWDRSYTVGDGYITATWTDDQAALGYLEYTLRNCGYTQEDFNAYFSEENRFYILANYEDVQETAHCSNRSERLDLYEYDAVIYDTAYQLRLWTKQVSATRFMYLLLVFPEDSRRRLDQASQQIFPRLDSCS
jgi:hypothetical protein